MLPTESCKPAPYGRACVGCSRAKCKCFHRSDGPGCERCHRLGKQCEPSANVRQRRSGRGSGVQPPTPSAVSSTSAKTVNAGRPVEGKAMERSQQEPSPATTVHHLSPPLATPEPDVAVDTDSGIIYFLPVRPAPSPILDDVSSYRISASEAQKRLEVFRTYFLAYTPFVHIPPDTTPTELLQKKPFLWFMIMALSTKDVGEQFRMESTLWHIVSRRIICEHLGDLDLLQGLICFGIWSIYFKQDKFFVGMLTQCAIALAHQLGIHTDLPSGAEVYKQTQQGTPQTGRSLEERRTYLALFHLSSSSWDAEKKTRPMEWTAYLGKCLHMLVEAEETPLDALFAMQIRCFIIGNQVTCPSPMDPDEGTSKPVPASTIATLQAQLDDIRANIPVHIQSLTATQLFLESTQLRLHEASFSRPLASDGTGHAHLQRIMNLEAALTCLERFFAALFDMPLSGWMGFSVQMFSQIMHALVVLYKLHVISEAGWDIGEVRRRADVFAILDRLTALVPEVIADLGLIDAPGPRTGVLFKGVRTFQLIKQFLAAQLPQGIVQTMQDSMPLTVPAPPSAPPVPPAPLPSDGSRMYGNRLGEPSIASGDNMPSAGIPDEVYRRILFEEAWATDIMNFSWDFPMQDASTFLGV